MISNQAKKEIAGRDKMQSIEHRAEMHRYKEMFCNDVVLFRKPTEFQNNEGAQSEQC